MKTLVIAEPGCTAEGDYATMVRLIHASADAGADVFKAQWTSDPEQMVARRSKNLSAANATAFRARYLQPYTWIAFPVEWHRDFAERCHRVGLLYGCTTFIASNATMVDAAVDFHKVASFENADASLVRAQFASGKPVIVSTGMLSRCDATYWRLRWWQWRCKVRLLQCSTGYPAPASAMNLSVIRRHRMDGLSDHSRHALTGALAVAAGATIVEAHLRLDDTPAENPDYAVAFSPSEFTQYVKNIRDAEVMLGTGRKEIQACEHEMLSFKVTS